MLEARELRAFSEDCFITKLKVRLLRSSARVFRKTLRENKREAFFVCVCVCSGVSFLSRPRFQVECGQQSIQKLAGGTKSGTISDVEAIIATCNKGKGMERSGGRVKRAK